MVQQLSWKVETDNGEAVVLSTHTLNAMASTRTKVTPRDMAQQLLRKVETDNGEAIVLGTHTLNAMVSMLLGYQRIFRKPPSELA